MKEVKLNRYEEALLHLAGYIEGLPHCEYKVREHIAGILGFEPIKKKKKITNSN